MKQQGLPFRKEHDLYFELSIGSFYESAGKDDLAIDCDGVVDEVTLPKGTILGVELH